MLLPKFHKLGKSNSSQAHDGVFICLSICIEAGACFAATLSPPLITLCYPPKSIYLMFGIPHLRRVRNGLFLFLLVLCSVLQAAGKPRVIVMSDIGGTEPDDKESFVRFLLYANELDIVGLIGANSKYGVDRGYLPAFQDIIDKYAVIRPNLLVHADGYPTATYLTSILREGQKGIVGMAGVGDDRTTPGSQLIVAELKKSDPRPVWILAWGGSSTLAQALWDLRKEGLSETELNALVAKIRFYEIAGQDDSGAWIANQFPEIFIVRSGNQFMSFSYRASWQGKPQQDGDLSVVNATWFRNNVQTNHGAYGAAYPNAVYMFEGDTPAFLYLVDNGLHDPEEPSQGSWGGRFTSVKVAPPDTYENKTDNNYAPAPMYINDADEYVFQGTTYDNIFTPLWRWRYEYQNDFAARIDWTTTNDFSAVNHEPLAVINSNATTDVLHLEVDPGEVVVLDASASSDPDSGDTLSFTWWQYLEAGTYGSPIAIANPAASSLSVTVPQDLEAGETIHLILSLKDDGDPALTSYRRVILIGSDAPPAPYKVLFIGNSFTIGSGESVAKLFDALAQAGGQPDPDTQMRAVGGKHFQFHATDATSQAAIQSQQWDYVVLQNYSTEPTHLASQNLADHFTYGEMLYDQIMANNPATQVILYETWSRSTAHSLISGTSGPNSFATTAEMQEELRTNYRALADQLNAAHPTNPRVLVAPAGDAWENAGALLAPSDPNFVRLHGSDEYHANDNGYYLNAAVFYSLIYNASPVGLSQSQKVTATGVSFTEDATFLEEIAWQTVLSGENPPSQLVDRLLIDFGSASNPTTTTGWNNIIPGTATLADMVDTDGETTSLGFQIVSPFNSDNDAGTANSSLFPGTATSDSLFGNTASFSGKENIFPVFRLTGLSEGNRYNLRFFASRMGVSDNRQTRYTVAGANTEIADLNPSGNIETSVLVENVMPDANGEITVSITAGPENTNNNAFTYLGVLEIEAYTYRTLQFASEPVSVSASEYTEVSFSAEVIGTPPFTVQWYADDDPIYGATDLTYTIPSVTSQQDGVEYHVTVSDGSTTITSQIATLTVLSDNTAPTLDDASVSADRLSIDLSFSEALDTTLATDPIHYGVLCEDTLIPVTAATLSPDGQTVTLALGAPAFGAYTVFLDPALADRAGNTIGTGVEFSGVIPDRSGAVLRFDFGSSSTPTSSADDGYVWNNIDTLGSTTNGTLNGLVTETGESTDYSLVILSRFNGANTSGTTSTSAPYPANATRDSLYGNIETFGGLENIFPRFKLAGLDPALTYTLTFYASRMNVSDIRESAYTVTGTGTEVVYLNASGNISGTVTVVAVTPDANNEIAIAIDPGPNNNNANHFAYLGALVVETSSTETSAMEFDSISHDSGNLILEWSGNAYLDYNDELDGQWTTLVPPPDSPVSLSMPAGLEHRFFRLRRRR